MGAKKKQRRRMGPGVIAAMTLLAVVLIGAWVAGNTLLVVETIQVEGNTLIEDQEVIAASGLIYGQSMLDISPDQVALGINANRYLQFVALYRDYPTKVILRVTENMPLAIVRTRGMLVIIDGRGVVLNQTSQLDLGLDVPYIEGLDLKSVYVGQELTTQVAAQAQAMRAVLTELSAQQVIEQISELNMSDLDNLYLVTVDGIQVLLGSADDLIDKIAMMRATLPEVRKLDMGTGGVLDVTARLIADFQPPKTYQTPKPTNTPEPTATPST